MSRNFGIIYGLIDSNKTIRYVGQTIQPVITRYKQHLWYSSKHKNHLGYWIIQNKKSIKIKILEYCGINELNEKELLWISKYNNLVNSMKGCELSKHHRHSEETKVKIGLSTIKTHTGLKRSQETKDKIAKSRIKYKGNKHPNFGKKFSQEHINKRVLKVNKPILQYNLNNEFIKEFSSITIASKELNVNFTNISSCCRGKQKTSYGYIWKFKN